MMCFWNTISKAISLHYVTCVLLFFHPQHIIIICGPGNEWMDRLRFRPQIINPSPFSTHQHQAQAPQVVRSRPLTNFGSGSHLIIVGFNWKSRHRILCHGSSWPSIKCRHKVRQFAQIDRVHLNILPQLTYKRNWVLVVAHANLMYNVGKTRRGSSPTNMTDRVRCKCGWVWHRWKLIVFAPRVLLGMFAASGMQTWQ